MSKYYLLTGATGLLGRYLLRNFLMRDVPVAVLVRGNRQASAAARIEAAMTDFESSLNRRLPRPVVLDGELTEPDLRLQPDAIHWVQHNVGAIIHSAAVLSFQDGERHEEPWRTNVTGTQTLLHLSRKLDIREFHYVSTAYVCGQRHDRVLESEFDMGQSFGNHYEQSKLEAESMVRSAAWLAPPTIYRPAIIVGDSRTGFTNTFHGFYAPLHICHALVNKLNLHAIQAQDDAWSLVELLGMRGTERKNLVPVDWVAAVITHLVLDNRHHGLVYHLTPEDPISTTNLCDVFLEAVVEHSVDWDRVAGGQAASGQSFAALQQAFGQQMTAYQAYFRDDPVFDATNTRTHAPHLPCPALDHDVLLRLCKFAIQQNFWWPRGVAVTSSFNVYDYLRRHSAQCGRPDHPQRPCTILNLRVNGRGGGDWKLALEGQQLQSVEHGSASSAVAGLFTNTEVLRSLAEGRLSLGEALRGGGVAVEGTSASRAEIQWLLEDVLSANGIQTQ